LFDALIPHLYEQFGEQLEIDLVTCYAGVPAGFRGTAYSVTDYSGSAGRKKLYLELAAAEYPIAVLTRARQPALAAEFVGLVLSSAGREVLARFDFQPGNGE